MPSLALQGAITQEPRTAALDRLAELIPDIETGRLIPYLGPGVLAAGPATSLPVTTEDLALALHARVPVGGRLRGNLWSTAQFIEQRRHRKTLTALMAEIFAVPAEPGPLHRWLATLKTPLIVDTWYDGALARAFREAGRKDFGEVQGITRAGVYRDVWWKCYGAAGQEVPDDVAAGWTTVLYKPHGSVDPAQNFLVADADYVEVLTEIDIQTPIPGIVQERRQGRGFLFLGCRFHDQLLRTYARQILKRSGGGHYAVVSGTLTRMEQRFLADSGAEPLEADLESTIAALTGQ